MTKELMPQYPILMVDDEETWLNRLAFTLEYEAGINNVIHCSDSRNALKIMRQQPISLVLLDLTMPHLAGEEVLTLAREEFPQVPIIILSGLNQIATAVECIRGGAADYFVKTDDTQRLLTGINKALTISALQKENQSLKSQLLQSKLKWPDIFDDIVTDDSRMKNIFRYMEAVSSSPEPVLITGESGVGKELIARALHRLHGSSTPFVALNTAGLDDHTFSDTLFGHVKGAFTDANRARVGLIEKASGGVLFLDEIGDISPFCQVKLLRFLQEGEYYPLGSDSARRINVRVVFATNQDLEQKQKEGTFRKDLYYRLCSHHIHIPPLRERKKDIPLLLNLFIDEATKKLGKKRPSYPKELENLLVAHPFPGNIRELRGLVFDAVSKHEKGILSLELFDKVLESQISESAFKSRRTENGSPFSSLEVLPPLDESIEMLVDEALSRAGNNQRVAAGLLGISRQALNKRLNNRK